MDERHHRQPGRFARDDLRHGAKGKAIDNGDRPVANGRERTSGVFECGSRWMGKAGIELQDVHLPAQMAKAFYHVPVVDIPTSTCLERGGRDEDDPRHRYDGPLSLASNDADAMCDS